jgi:hypothetical protein
MTKKGDPRRGAGGLGGDGAGFMNARHRHCNTSATEPARNVAPRFAKVPASVIADRRLGDRDFRLLCALLSYARAECGCCWPANKTLADVLGISTRAIRGRIARLVALGYVRRNARHPGMPRHARIFNLPSVAGPDMPHIREVAIQPSLAEELTGGGSLPSALDAGGGEAYLPPWAEAYLPP